MRLLYRCVCVLALCAYAAAQSSTSLAGDWAITMDVFGTPVQQVLTLKGDGNKLSGSLRGRGRGDIDGTISGSAVHFVLKQDKDTTGEYDGTVSSEGMSGTAHVFNSQPERRLPA